MLLSLIEISQLYHRAGSPLFDFTLLATDSASHSNHRGPSSPLLACRFFDSGHELKLPARVVRETRSTRSGVTVRPAVTLGDVFGSSRVPPYPSVSRCGLAVKRTGKQKGLGSIPLRLSFLSLQKGCGLWTLSCDFVPHNDETLK